MGTELALTGQPVSVAEPQQDLGRVARPLPLVEVEISSPPERLRLH